MIYFFPGAKTLSSRLLAAAGVSDLLDAPIVARDTTVGPGDVAGLLVTRQTAGDPDLRYAADRQRWLQRDAAASCWLGCWCEQTHAPANYAREKQFDGERIRLADGSQWIVPRIREFRETDQDSPFSVRYCLPRSLTYDPETGAFAAGQVVHQYRAIADEAVAIGEAVHSQLIGTGSAALEQGRIDRFAGGVMRLNYRLDVPELGLIELLDETTLTQIVRAALHLDWFEASLKKRLATRHFPPSNISDGASPPIEA